jgi:hypothetical protein
VSRPVLIASGVVTFVVGLVALRLAVDGIQPYGTDGAEYIEHTARLETLRLWREGGERGLWTRLVETDGSFPAGLHLLTLPLGALIGHKAVFAAASSLGWLLVLLASTASIAANLVPSKRTLAASAAAAGLALVPAIHASAGRYYFDLPMIALLWLAAAVLFWGRDRRPVVVGLIAAGLGFLACLVKWAAIPFGAPLFAVLLLGRSPSRRPVYRLVACGLALAIPAWLVLQYLGDVPGTSSFGHQAAITSPGAGSGLAGLLPSADRLRWVDLIFYPARAATSIFSPVLFAVVVWLGLRGLKSDPLRLLPWTMVVAAHVGFAVLVVPVLDDRFVLPAVPAVVLLAVVGWLGLPAHIRRRVAVVVVAVGAIVATDFHFAPPSALTYPLQLIGARHDNSPWTRARGLGAASSVELRGWARHDEAEPAREALRGDVWTVIEACGRGVCIAGERNVGAIGRFGDQEWVRFRGMLEEERTGHETHVITTCPTRSDRVPQECTADLAIEPLGPGDLAPPPGCIDDGIWELHTLVPDPDGGNGVGVWRKQGAPVCPLPSR